MFTRASKFNALLLRLSPFHSNMFLVTCDPVRFFTTDKSPPLEFIGAIHVWFTIGVSSHYPMKDELYFISH